MLSPEQVIERAKKWEIIFDAYDNKKQLRVKVEKKLKKGYLVRILDLDLLGHLKTKRVLNLGDEILAYIVSANYVDKRIELKLSAKTMDEEKIFKILKKVKKNNTTIRVKVVGVANGGFEISVLGKKGFIPPSHIPKKFWDNLDEHIGKEYDAYILRVNKDNLLASLRELS